MTIYLTVEQLIAINADQDGGVGVRDRDGVEAAAYRPQTDVFGVEEFQGEWNKAGAYLHSFATTQHFFDGNKRTAWYAAVTFLLLNGVRLPAIPDIESEVFVNAVALDAWKADGPDATIQRAAEWFEAKWRGQRVGPAIDPRVEYIYAATAYVPGSITYTAQDIGLATVVASSFPTQFSFGLIGRLHWSGDDLGKAHKLSVRITRVGGGESLFTPDYWQDTFDESVPPSTQFGQNPAGVLPVVFDFPLNTVIAGPGDNVVSFFIDGILAAQIPLSIQQVNEVPDGVSSP
ncbi:MULTISPECIES: Fic family protein [Actinomycetes]|uniref:type II toxin-antitoxin system death-on-curing family toxin n=1 Tax=Actinomycetes TaxID=1760 RepID=UPI00068E2E58|nr:MULTISPECIES: Fic family protein [Actinomycetes]